ncbi:MAG TPA: metallophosphoesterase family protein [Solirubrobacteraceae bacterium]|nr:metallophosphoesterase family protein [Solirubrobacteraceae bacterium]
MRLAVVSDIHGNLTALEAVAADIERRGVDQVVHGGDVALIGARPAEVVDRVAELGWPGIVGNTDELLWRQEQFALQLRAAPRLEPLLRMLFDNYAPATLDRIGEERLALLRELPESRSVANVGLVHASPGDLWRAPMPDAGDQELEVTYGQAVAEIVIYGHIHRPFVRQIGALTVANAGSVGLPFDGDPRASYLLIQDDRAEVIRVAYAVEAEVAALRASGYPDSDRIARMLRTGRFEPVRQP